MRRRCARCCRDLHHSAYTKNQIAKGSGMSRCASCVHGLGTIGLGSIGSRVVLLESGRYNKSHHAVFYSGDLDHPFAHGAFRWVAKGRFESGPRHGQGCVAKWFKAGAVYSEDYFALDLKAVDKALRIANQFNMMNFIDKKVVVNVPQVWTFDEGAHDARWVGQKALHEPYIHNYQKFNSNTGWSDDSKTWGEIMQALSHFSYHATGGNYVLCDLQGGIYEDEIVLSDPVVLSRVREYGLTDLGSAGISTFFSQHKCNRFCCSYWSRPAAPVKQFNPVPGTTMMSQDGPKFYTSQTLF